MLKEKKEKNGRKKKKKNIGKTIKHLET